MRYFIVLDGCGSSYALNAIYQERDEVIYLLPPGVNKNLRSQLLKESGSAQACALSRISDFNLSSGDRVIVHVSDRDTGVRVIKHIRSLFQNTPVLFFDPTPERLLWGNGKEYSDPCLSVLPVNSVLQKSAREKWRHIEIRKRIEKLKKTVDQKKPLWILIQNDPDPDAIASAMGLRELLGRNEKTAPIVTLKKVSRTENISMIKIMKVTVTYIDAAKLKHAPQIAMVDVQPSYFRQSFDNLKIVIDHHPVVEKFSAEFKDVHEEYGATSSMLTEYLVANGVKIGQRLGTALYYGIKTDTLLFGRDVSNADFKAFSILWPKANHNHILRMERPRLQSEEVDVFIKALKGHIVEKGCIFAGLGAIPKEDLVPRLADFILQIGDSEFAVVWGIINRNVTFSARSLTPYVNAGEVMRLVFGKMGSAGGHQSMARATVAISDLKKEFKTRSIKELTEGARKRVCKIVTDHKHKNSRVAARPR